MKYIIKKLYRYSETVEVFAKTDSEAIELSMNKEGDRNYDDNLYDCVIVNVIDNEEIDEE